MLDAEFVSVTAASSDGRLRRQLLNMRFSGNHRSPVRPIRTERRAALAFMKECLQPPTHEVLAHNGESLIDLCVRIAQHAADLPMRSQKVHHLRRPVDRYCASQARLARPSASKDYGPPARSDARSAMKRLQT